MDDTRTYQSKMSKMSAVERHRYYQCRNDSESEESCCSAKRLLWLPSQYPPLLRHGVFCLWVEDANAMLIPTREIQIQTLAPSWDFRRGLLLSRLPWYFWIWQELHVTSLMTEAIWVLGQKVGIWSIEGNPIKIFMTLQVGWDHRDEVKLAYCIMQQPRWFDI